MWENFCESYFIYIESAKKAIAQKIHQENFRVMSKVRENRKSFTFVIYGIYSRLYSLSLIYILSVFLDLGQIIYVGEISVMHIFAFQHAQMNF